MAVMQRSERKRHHRGGSVRIRDLDSENGSPLTTRELAAIIGMSQTFIRNEIRGGQLTAVALGRGKKRVFRILFREAQRYVRQLGFP
jgi:hypothetical protein